MDRVMQDTDEARLRAFAQAFDLDVPPPFWIEGEGVTVVALAYNEALRLPHFLDHHRALGARGFIIVDNGSDDGSAALLDAQADVLRLPSTKPYSENVVAWRRLIGDIYLAGRWALFADIDELFVHPGWPSVPLDVCLRHWDAKGVEAVLAPLVDMYPEGPLEDLDYRPGQPFLDACPLFDGEGYRLMPRAGQARTHHTPSVALFGGARERLFFSPERRAGWTERLLLRAFFAPDGPVRRGPLRFRLDRWAKRRLSGAIPQEPPTVLKVPLVKWQRGLSYVRGPHRLAARVPLAAEWGALLHFKYLDDFAEKVETALDRGQHFDGAVEYRRYDAEAEALMARGAAYPGSHRFEGVASLERVGLMRSTRELDAALAEERPKDRSGRRSYGVGRTAAAQSVRESR